MVSPWEDADFDLFKQMDRRSLLALTAGLGGSLFVAENIFANQKSVVKPSTLDNTPH